MSVTSELFLRSFVSGTGKTIGSLFIMAIVAGTWYIYTDQEKCNFLKKPKIIIKSKKNKHLQTTYSDIEQINNEADNDNEVDNEADNEADKETGVLMTQVLFNNETNQADIFKIRDLFDTSN